MQFATNIIIVSYFHVKKNFFHFDLINLRWFDEFLLENTDHLK